MKTFTELLNTSFQEHPDKIAIVLQRQGQPDLLLTYRDLLAGATGVAKTLQQREIKQGEVVILILQHGLDLIYSYFGIILHGAIPSIMPFLTEKLLPERYRADLSSLFKVTRPSMVITYPEFVDEVQAAMDGDTSIRGILLTTEFQSPSNPDFDSIGGCARKPDDIVLLQHSSGTTGLQKGVALTHRAVFNQLQNYSKAIDLSSSDVVVSWLPLYHDMGLIAGFLMPILLGVKLILMSPFDWVKAPVRLLKAVSEYRGTLSWLPNFAYNFCAQKIRERDLEGIDLSSWRAVINCSEPMRWESHQKFQERFSPNGLRANALCTSYAMAENVFAVTQGGIKYPPTVEFIDRESLQVAKIAKVASSGEPVISMLSAGFPIENVEIQILSERKHPLPDRHVGEIAIKSNCMLSEYYHRPDATEKAFHQGWYLTGDFGYKVNDEVYITGRKKDLIIVGGKNVYPQDLELLAMEVPGVHMGRVSAFGVFNELSGTEDVVLVAEVDTDDTKERERIEDQIREVITRGSAVALRNVYLVNRHWMVKTSSGKTARSANRDKYLTETGQLSQVN